MEKIIWLKPNEYQKQKYTELRLYAPQNEKILLDFNPLRISDESDWDPMWEEWHCYYKPLRIYKQDYELLLDYINKVYPIKDAIDGTLEPIFDICFNNWIGKDYWYEIINEIEQDIENIPDKEKFFFGEFIQWIKEALKYTSIIVVEGNL